MGRVGYAWAGLSYALALVACGNVSRYPTCENVDDVCPVPPPGTATIFLHAPDGDLARAHGDRFAGYLDWDGASWCTRLYGETFARAPGCDWSAAVLDTVLQFQTWDGGRWSAKVDGNGFLLAPEGDFSQAHADPELRYEYWTGVHWSMRLPNLLVDAPGGDVARAHSERLISYLDGQHAQQCASFFGTIVARMPECNPEHVNIEASISYTAWDGTVWSASANGASFAATPAIGSTPTESAAVQYQQWDGSDWAVSFP